MAHGDKSVTTEVLPTDTIRVKPLQARITIDVVIPALNEERCVEGLLHNVMISRNMNVVSSGQYPVR